MFHDDPQDPLCKAAKFVDQAIGVDNNFMDLAALMGIDSINEPTIGGCEPIEYPSTSFQVPELAPLKIKMLPIELQERLKQFQCNCQMGIFTEIGRAWLTIDNELYLWTYDDGSDIAYYDGLNEVILCLAIVRPKPNIFQSHISHLLCITTPIEVVLLGVTFAVTSGMDSLAATSYNDLQILQEPLFALATDNVHMTSVVGTNDGRIFMAGKDGCLYEMHYQGDLGWLGRRSCRLINHSTTFSSYILPSFMSSYFSKDDPLVQLCYDDSRKLLIARSLKSSLQVFYLGPHGNKFSKIGHCDYERTLKKVSKNFDKTRLGSIVHVAPVPASDSERIHLVATTNTGVRLYYTTWECSDNPQQTAISPDCLALIHIRNPPNLGGSVSPHRLPRSTLFPLGQLNDVHLAAYSQGTHLMSSASMNDDGDMLCTFSHDSFPFINMFSESYESTQLAGKVWDIREVQMQDAQIKDLIRDPVVATPQSPVFPDPPAIVTQHYLGNKKFAIVSSVGVCIAMKLSPCEQLQQLLIRNSVDSEPVRAYFRLMKEQAMTSCLALMCSKNSMHLQVNSIATRAYNIYKWDASFGQVLVPEQTSTPIAGQLRRNANFQQMSGMPQNATPLVTQTQFEFASTSLNHRSLYLYLARILRPVWCHKVVTTVPDPETKGTFLTSRLNSEQILLVLQKCQDFLHLLRNYPSILAHVPSSNPGVSVIMPDSFSLPRNMSLRGMDFEADETTSLRNLESLLDICCQCLSMWKILADHQFHVVAARLKQEDREALAGAGFSQLILSHRNLCKQLITTLVDFYIDDNAITDVISSRLRESCPLLYSSQDQAQTKGNECLKLAKIASNPLEKRKLIQNAVQQYKVTIASPSPSAIQHNAPVGDLPSMCTRLASVGAYLGLVDLALAAASKRDPNDVAQHFYLCSKPPEDVEGAKLFAVRSECYKPIAESLDYLSGLCSQDSESKGRDGLGKLISSIIPSFFSSSAGDKDLVSPLTNGYVMTSEEANNQMEEMVHMIMKSEDQMAHFALFDWMNGKGLSEKLLDLPSPYLEQYLKLESHLDFHHQPQQQQLKQKDMLDLLANYYIKEKKFSLAARILDKLAMKAGNHMSLKERHKYMSKAVVCLQSSVSRADSEFMHEVQDKVEVILLQLKVMKELEKCTSRPERMIEDAVHLLDTQLFDVSKLYADFSIPFELPVCKLAIVRSTGIREANLINSIWREIIDKELKSSVGQDPQQRMEILSAHFVLLGKDYLKEEIYFPLPFLVMHLEQLSITEGFSKLDLTFVAKSFLETGVAAKQLHDVYEMLFRQKDSFWKNQRQQYHLVEVDIFIMKQIIDAFGGSFSVQQNRRQMLNRCLDGISFYLVELQSDSSRDECIVNSLREIQIKMERLER